MYCTGLKQLTVPNSMRIVCSQAFENTGIEQLDLGHGVQFIMDRAFNAVNITALMQHGQVYLQSELKLADMAAMLGVTQQQMTRCVKQETGLSFTLFANRYRIDHAKRIMQEQPDTKLASVALASGFTNETSFFRVFKAITGLTPKEWLTRQDSSP